MTGDMALDYRIRPITVDDYHRMAEAGIFAPDERVELIDGELIAVPPMGSLHAGAIGRLTRLLTTRLNDRALVRVQCPVIIYPRSEPEPAFVVVPPDPHDWSRRHPEARDVLLLVEVSYSSRSFDLRKKVPLYARAGIRDVWLLDLVDHRLLVFRDPGPDGYATTFVLGPTDTVALLAFPGEAFNVADILGERPT